MSSSSRPRHSTRFNEAAGIPRGRRGGAPAIRWPTRGFNEAAGIPRGRRERRRVGTNPERRASMRPRVFPAEDLYALPELIAIHVASMRPRVFPAEDEAATARAAAVGDASMRPRVFPAEDGVEGLEARGETALQ